MQLYDHLRATALEERCQQLQACLRDHQRLKQRQQALYQANSLKALRRARVVAMTTSGVAGSQDLVAAMRPRVSGSSCAEQ